MQFSDLYSVHNIVAKSDKSSIFLCKDKSENEFLYQVPTEKSSDSAEKNVFILDKLNQNAAIVQASTDAVLNYDLGFPKIVDKFDLETTSSYVIKFNGIDVVGTVVPLIKMLKSDLRVDLQTSAWIMGKLLKTMSFAHQNGIEVVDFSANNVLIQPDKHYVIVFDWSKSEFQEITQIVAKREIKKVANLILKILGNLESAKESEVNSYYIDYIEKLADRGETSAVKAHADFYSVVDKLCSMPDSTWKHEFHKFLYVSRK